MNKAKNVYTIGIKSSWQMNFHKTAHSRKRWEYKEAIVSPYGRKMYPEHCFGHKSR